MRSLFHRCRADNSPTVEASASCSDILPAVTRTQMAIVGAFFGVAFAISSILRGDVAPGLVGGLLGGLVVYLVLQRVTAHHADLRRRRERDMDRHG